MLDMYADSIKDMLVRVCVYCTVHSIISILLWYTYLFRASLQNYLLFATQTAYSMHCALPMSFHYRLYQ
jgi:hypothetical protein